MAQHISDFGLPTALIQEGGYEAPSLGANLAAFLSAFETRSDFEVS
jgi:hypothetical protein